jgi:hypothetical protein
MGIFALALTLVRLWAIEQPGSDRPSTGFEMPAQTEHREIPTHADGARTKLIPEVAGTWARCSSRRRVPPSDHSLSRKFTQLIWPPIFPREVERSGRIACGDLAAGIALQLVASINIG